MTQVLDDRPPNWRLYAVINSDLEMSEGKKISQGSHALIETLDVARNDHPERFYGYRLEPPGTKLVLKATEREIRNLMDKAEELDLPCYLMVDSPPTTEGTEYKVTAAGFGPLTSKESKLLRKQSLL